MKKIITILLAAMVCLSISCKDDDDDNKEPETSAKYLTAAQFASSSWTGSDTNGEVNLSVTSTTNMTLTYYEPATISKNVDPEPATPKTVKITYTFNEGEGTFSGSGDNSASYSGKLTSTTALLLKMPSGEVSMTKK